MPSSETRRRLRQLYISAGANLLAESGSTVTHNVSATNSGPPPLRRTSWSRFNSRRTRDYDTGDEQPWHVHRKRADAQRHAHTCTVGDLSRYETKTFIHTAVVTGAHYDVLPSRARRERHVRPRIPKTTPRASWCRSPGRPCNAHARHRRQHAHRLQHAARRREQGNLLAPRRRLGSRQSDQRSGRRQRGFVWSPDGTKIAFSRLVDESANNRELFVG